MTTQFTKKLSLRRMLLLGLTVPCVLSLLWYAFVPKPELIPDLTHSKAFYAKDGELLRLTLSHDQQYRLWKSLDEIPQHFQDAAMLYEDQYFYSHPGVNPFALARATYSSYISKGRRMGASTITMQLARLRFKLKTNTIGGKFEQIKSALALERHYSKEQILEAYLNLAPYGHNIQGIGAASLIYFHKPAAQLSPTESLLLAVVPQNPNKRIPSSEKGYQYAKQARTRLIELWSAEKNSSEEEQSRLALDLHIFTPGELPYRAPHFVESLLQDKTNPLGTYQTSLDLGLQNSIEDLTRSYIGKTQRHGIKNAAVMLLDYRNMQIVSELGSVNYFDNTIQGQVNGTRALRSPGSTLKPFIYGLALEQGLIHPQTLLKDAPTRFGAYTPENYDQHFSGPINASDALVKSRNIPAVDLMRQLKGPDFHAWLQITNPERLNTKEHYGLALALGGNEVSMLELVQWYAMLANRGSYKKAVALNSELQKKLESHALKLMTDEASFLTLDMLANNPPVDRIENIQNLQNPLANEMPLPWKTGTSFAFRDAWALGVVGHYVLAVWVGNFDGSANPSLIGRKAAGPLYFGIARQLQIQNPEMVAEWNSPNSYDLVKVDVCKTSGGLNTEHCPKIIESWFIPGVSPIKANEIYREVLIDKASQLRACKNDVEKTEKKVFEFWPSDTQKVFRQAGLYKKLPPPFLPECIEESLNALGNIVGNAPNITSPMSTIAYALQSHKLEDEKIPLTATVDSNSSELFWFIGNEFVGSTTPNDSLMWPAQIGNFDVTVIDDLGRSSQVAIRTNLVN